MQELDPVDDMSRNYLVCCSFDSKMVYYAKTLITPLIYIMETIGVVINYFQKLGWSRHMCSGNDTLNMLRFFEQAGNLSTDMLFNMKLQLRTSLAQS